MYRNLSKLNIVKAYSGILDEELGTIRDLVLRVFEGLITEVNIGSIGAPSVESIDFMLLAAILEVEIEGHTLGVTDADLRVDQHDQFYGYVFGGKSLSHDIAIVSTSRLAPQNFSSERDHAKYLSRIMKVGLHEVGHNYGLLDHYSYKNGEDGSLCLMSRGEYNKFGQLGYIRTIIDGRGFLFCQDCTSFLNHTYR